MEFFLLATAFVGFGDGFIGRRQADKMRFTLTNILIGAIIAIDKLCDLCRRLCRIKRVGQSASQTFDDCSLVDWIIKRKKR